MEPAISPYCWTGNPLVVSVFDLFLMKKRVSPINNDVARDIVIRLKAMR